jgi:hypothetical protein
VFRLKSLSSTSLPATPANTATPRQAVAELARVAAGSDEPDTERVAELATVAGSRCDATGDELSMPDECQSLSPVQEAARRQVLAELKSHPTVKRAFCNRFEDGALIITLAIRDVGSCELLIPADRFDSSKLADYAALLECFAVNGA